MKLIFADNEHNAKVKEEVMNQAWKEFQRIHKRILGEEKFLEDKTYHMCDYVVYQQVTGLDTGFGIQPGTIGKIVGYDWSNNYYRVYLSKENPYIGVRVEKLRLYNEETDGKIPEDVENEDPYEIKMISITLQ